MNKYKHSPCRKNNDHETQNNPITKHLANYIVHVITLFKYMLEKLATYSVHQTEENKTKTQHYICWIPLYVNKRNTIYVDYHYTQANVTLYMLITTIRKQT